jgi:hypothetical protein
MTIDYAEVYRLAKRGRRSERRREVLTGCLTGLVTGALTGLIKGWLFMLTVGVAHAEWVPMLPTIGFWWSVLLMVIMPSLGGTSSKKDDS